MSDRTGKREKISSSIARQVTVLHQGAVLCEGPVEQVQNDPRVLEVYLGRKREGADAVH